MQSYKLQHYDHFRKITMNCYHMLPCVYICSYNQCQVPSWGLVSKRSISRLIRTCLRTTGSLSPFTVVYPRYPKAKSPSVPDASAFYYISSARAHWNRNFMQDDTSNPGPLECEAGVLQQLNSSLGIAAAVTSHAWIVKPTSGTHANTWTRHLQKSLPRRPPSDSLKSHLRPWGCLSARLSKTIYTTRGSLDAKERNATCVILRGLLVVGGNVSGGDTGQLALQCATVVLHLVYTCPSFNCRLLEVLVSLSLGHHDGSGFEMKYQVVHAGHPTFPPQHTIRRDPPGPLSPQTLLAAHHSNPIIPTPNPSSPPSPSQTHTYCLTRQFRSRFGQQWIGRRVPIAWPARSPDLNPLGYFLWRDTKGVIYETPVESEEDLLAWIMAAEDLGLPGIGDRVYQNIVRRYRDCVDDAGRHIESFLTNPTAPLMHCAEHRPTNHQETSRLQLTDHMRTLRYHTQADPIDLIDPIDPIDLIDPIDPMDATDPIDLIDPSILYDPLLRAIGIGVSVCIFMGFKVGGKLAIATDGKTDSSRPNAREGLLTLNSNKPVSDDAGRGSVIAEVKTRHFILAIHIRGLDHCEEIQTRARPECSNTTNMNCENEVPFLTSTITEPRPASSLTVVDETNYVPGTKCGVYRTRMPNSNHAKITGRNISTRACIASLRKLATSQHGAVDAVESLRQKHDLAFNEKT
ncbi:hypothetical protein PR048_021199 [Dryococelus australis]|uniref:Uncharacterized protein n=1 Tax=Dryococelus australis TaxID=614101 RepID=A0ABQ9GXJ6_9NEOP|nr:hypothetical protein PR048_021199 [Dryococelus australis]